MTANTLENPEECGRFRISEDDKIYVRDKEENTLYEPPRPEQIDSMLEMLYSYANDSDEKNYTHPAIKAINLHFICHIFILLWMETGEQLAPCFIGT